MGKDSGATNGVRLEVHNTVGKKSGEVKITEVLGNNRSNAKVDKHGKEIKQAIDNGETLTIISDKTGIFDGFGF